MTAVHGTRAVEHRSRATQLVLRHVARSRRAGRAPRARFVFRHQPPVRTVDVGQLRRSRLFLHPPSFAVVEKCRHHSDERAATQPSFPIIERHLPTQCRLVARFVVGYRGPEFQVVTRIEIGASPRSVCVRRKCRVVAHPGVARLVGQEPPAPGARHIRTRRAARRGEMLVGSLQPVQIVVPVHLLPHRAAPRDRLPHQVAVVLRRTVVKRQPQ